MPQKPKVTLALFFILCIVVIPGIGQTLQIQGAKNQKDCYFGYCLEVENKSEKDTSITIEPGDRFLPHDEDNQIMISVKNQKIELPADSSAFVHVVCMEYYKGSPSRSSGYDLQQSDSTDREKEIANLLWEKLQTMQIDDSIAQIAMWAVSDNISEAQILKFSHKHKLFGLVSKSTEFVNNSGEGLNKVKAILTEAGLITRLNIVEALAKEATESRTRDNILREYLVGLTGSLYQLLEFQTAQISAQSRRSKEELQKRESNAKIITHVSNELIKNIGSFATNQTDSYQDLIALIKENDHEVFDANVKVSQAVKSLTLEVNRVAGLIGNPQAWVCQNAWGYWLIISILCLFIVLVLILFNKTLKCHCKEAELLDEKQADRFRQVLEGMTSILVVNIYFKSKEGVMKNARLINMDWKGFIVVHHEDEFSLITKDEIECIRFKSKFS